MKLLTRAREDEAAMHATYAYPTFPYRRSADQDAPVRARHPVVIVGAGPVGLSLAIDLAMQGVRTVVLDEDETVSVGSRAVCYAKRALEIWDRLGVAAPMVAKGVGWQRGRVFHRDDQVYEFDLLPDSGHGQPAFINLQQYYLEEYLVRRAGELPEIELRWKNRVLSVAAGPDGATLQVETPEGVYALDCDWLVAADGARSGIRRQLGLEFKGQVFRDRFLIADVVMQGDVPAERWFWFDPPFHRNQSALLHRQADNVWRIDLQLGWDADPEEERKPERVIPRLQAMLGKDRAFELEWVSIYTFQCRRLDRFRHGRVLFAGDAAHQVSPFGARGANSGVQDTDNLAWKLRLVLQGQAPAALLESYDAERVAAADENILNSTRSTDFITPKTPMARALRDAVLDLARDHAFARPLVNSGRLSTPCTYRDSPLNTPDAPGEAFAGAMVPGAPCADAPVLRDGAASWLLGSLGFDFVGLLFADAATLADGTALAAWAARQAVPTRPLLVVPDAASAEAARGAGLPALVDAEGLAARRYDAAPGSFHLIRPDQHVAARRRCFDAALATNALARATGRAARPMERAA
jgi:3-(3-hydroxy-phenyl)propionate hydroxylase